MKKNVLFFMFILSTFTVFGKDYVSSDKCLNFIKEYEKCSLTAYWDSNGYSIGYGHHSNVKANDVITVQKANALLAEDVKEAEKYVNYLLNKLPYTYKFDQKFIDGFTSFVYNVGVGNAETSTFYCRLKKCRIKNGVMDSSDYEYTLSAIKTSCISCKGHKKRRLGEYKLMKGYK